MSATQATLILTRGEIEPLMEPGALIEAVEGAFLANSTGRTFANAMIHGETPGPLEFHIKSGGLIRGERRYFGLKANGSNFVNRDLRGLPNILGAIILFDGDSGYPLAILESTVLTRHRTAAGTAAALKRLAPRDADSVAIFGCGNQGRMHVRYLREILPVKEVWAYDANPLVAADFAAAISKAYGISTRVANQPRDAAAQARVLVTCTPAKAPFLRSEDIRQGATIAAIGSDSPDKQELEASILAGAKVITDILDQCAAAGELHHALEAGLMGREDVWAEIGEIIAEAKPGRTNETESIVYDATGTALQDTAGAIVVFEQARRRGLGRMIDLFAA